MDHGKNGRLTYLPTYEDCFVCGQSHPRGLRMRFFMGGFGQVCGRFTPNADHTVYENIIHGGVISALMGELLGWPIALQTGRLAVCGEITMSFRRPMTVGREYLATAFPGVDRARCWEGSGEVRDVRNKVVARARGKYFLLSIEQTDQVAGKLTYRHDDAQVFRFGGRNRGERKQAEGDCAAAALQTPL